MHKRARVDASMGMTRGGGGVLVEREQDVLRAASMYYLQDLKMEVIARHLGTSRSTVSRLLRHARDTGLVEITLRPSSTRAPGLGRSISSTFGIDTYVVPVPDSAGSVERLDQVAMTAARLIGSWFDSDMVMGIAWGTTRAAVSRYLAPKPTRGSAVVQLNGAANMRTSGVEYASDLISSFGSAFDAAVHHFDTGAERGARAIDDDVGGRRHQLYPLHAFGMKRSEDAGAVDVTTQAVRLIDVSGQACARFCKNHGRIRSGERVYSGRDAKRHDRR